uniref:60S ribosomal protein L9 n=1 Tax=Ditylenchus dipsaci TaxID=166011 RepID=A0A915D432_9BILA
MKVIESSDTVKFPENVKFVLNKRTVKVVGPRGALSRNFAHLNIEILRDTTMFFASESGLGSARSWLPSALSARTLRI